MTQYKGQCQGCGQRWETRANQWGHVEWVKCDCNNEWEWVG